MTFARALTDPRIRRRAVHLGRLLLPQVRSLRFWILVTLGLLLAGALWIAVTGRFAKGEVREAATAVVNAGADKLDYHLGCSVTWRRSGCGATRTITLRPREPYTAGPLHVLRRPLVRPLAFRSSSQECA
jgi:hypothetical protein